MVGSDGKSSFQISFVLLKYVEYVVTGGLGSKLWASVQHVGFSIHGNPHVLLGR